MIFKTIQQIRRKLFPSFFFFLKTIFSFHNVKIAYINYCGGKVQNRVWNWKQNLNKIKSEEEY